MYSLESKNEYSKFIKSLPDYKTSLISEELKQIDFSFDEIVNKFIKTKVREKELSILKYIIEKQNEKIKFLEKRNKDNLKLLKKVGEIMNIQILSKKYVGNIRYKTNTVYFKINGIPKEVDIINYFDYEKVTTYNAYVETENNNKLWEYIKSCGYDLITVQEKILYEIWRYSHGKGVSLR